MNYPHLKTNIISALTERMDANKHKGDSWQTCDPQWLYKKLHEEYAEVILDPNNPKELADLANIVLMLLWRYSR